jgi:hypothetical protein
VATVMSRTGENKEITSSKLRTWHSLVAIKANKQEESRKILYPSFLSGVPCIYSGIQQEKKETHLQQRSDLFDKIWSTQHSRFVRSIDLDYFVFRSPGGTAFFIGSTWSSMRFLSLSLSERASYALFIIILVAFGERFSFQRATDFPMTMAFFFQQLFWI